MTLTGEDIALAAAVVCAIGVFVTDELRWRKRIRLIQEASPMWRGTFVKTYQDAEAAAIAESDKRATDDYIELSGAVCQFLAKHPMGSTLWNSPEYRRLKELMEQA